MLDWFIFAALRSQKLRRLLSILLILSIGILPLWQVFSHAIHQKLVKESFLTGKHKGVALKMDGRVTGIAAGDEVELNGNHYDVLAEESDNETILFLVADEVEDDTDNDDEDGDTEWVQTEKYDWLEMEKTIRNELNCFQLSKSGLIGVLVMPEPCPEAIVHPPEV